MTDAVPQVPEELAHTVVVRPLEVVAPLTILGRTLPPQNRPQGHALGKTIPFPDPSARGRRIVRHLSTAILGFLGLELRAVVQHQLCRSCNHPMHHNVIALQLSTMTFDFGGRRANTAFRIIEIISTITKMLIPECLASYQFRQRCLHMTGGLLLHPSSVYSSFRLDILNDLTSFGLGPMDSLGHLGPRCKSL